MSNKKKYNYKQGLTWGDTRGLSPLSTTELIKRPI
jgi:hypothetical protein